MSESTITKTHTGSLQVLDGSGDSRFMWNKDNADEVSAAKETFQKLKDKKYLAYKVNADGSRGEVIREFDPTAEKIIMAPQLVGG